MIRILFVCTGNTCRSPMAEAILKDKQIPGVEVKSAGVYAMPGQDASENAKKVMKKNNLDHTHSSCLLSEQEAAWADYIFTMTEGHKSLVASAYPRAMDKTFTLKEFVLDDGSRDVTDPYGSSEEQYSRTFLELQRLIDKLAEKLLTD